VNVERLSKQPNSILSIYKALIALRNTEKVLQYGDYERLEYQDDQLLFTRTFAGEKITVIINFGVEKKIMLPSKAKILLGGTSLEPNHFLIYKH
jgi:trehalose-6-phosphate hydrolase